MNYNFIWAQQTQSSKRISEKNSKLFKELKLSKTQQTRLINIIRNYKKQKEEISIETSKKTKRNKIKYLKEDTTSEIVKMLTDEQKYDFKNLERNRIKRLIKNRH